MLTRGRLYERRAGERLTLPLAPQTGILKGALVMVEGSTVVPGKTAKGLATVGIAENSVQAAAAGQTANVDIRRDGWFPFANSADDPISRADIGRDCFVVDDNTLAKTHGGNTRSVAGIVRDVDATGVWISFK
ncbi:hypothetical protein [Polycladidibacter hongkongensis]|uniref:hypothetical protein n=1 Tax=Polycladidibacter hongkongensis TaxID=1647556 RepID=UPI000830264F|nr:hypothetical protein [Pseudovibrio hongkongensis]